MSAYTAAYADIRINDTTRFRTQMSWFASQLETIGWTKTGASGQIDWSAVSAPGAIDTAMGYEIRVSSENLYLKIEYGSGYGAYSKSFWVTFGLGSDGAGTITTPLTTRIQVRSACGATGGAARAGDDFVAGGATRLMFCCTDDPNANYGSGIVLQRTHDAALTEDTDGTWWLLVWGYPSASGADIYHVGARSAEHMSAKAFGIARLPRAVGDASNIPILPLYAQGPLAAWVAVRDALAGQTALIAHQSTASINGRTYLSAHGGVGTSAFWGINLQHNHSLLVRYD